MLVKGSRNENILTWEFLDQQTHDVLTNLAIT